MNILARTGKARWCSRCGDGWEIHMVFGVLDANTRPRQARCTGAEWTTRGRAKRIRQYNNLAARLYVEAAKETP